MKHNSLIDFLKPLFLENLVRIGQDYDGGYCINNCVLDKTKTLISLGLHHDWSFEEDFVRKQATACIVHGVDGTLKGIEKRAISTIKTIKPLKRFRRISRLKGIEKKLYHFWSQPGFHLYEKNLASYPSDNTITVEALMKKIEGAQPQASKSLSTFVKMDIELSELDVIESFLKFSEQINGFVIEFHEIEKVWSLFKMLVEKLKQKYTLTHISNNNCSRYIPSIGLCSSIELSFLHSSLVQKSELLHIHPPTYPRKGLDQPNTLKFPDPDILFNAS